MDTPNESPEAMFQRILNMPEGLARTLSAGGIMTLEELGYVPISELLGVAGLRESDAQLFRKRARAFLLRDALDGEGDAETSDA